MNIELLRRPFRIITEQAPLAPESGIESQGDMEVALKVLRRRLCVFLAPQPGARGLRGSGLVVFTSLAASREPGDIFYILYRGSMGILFFLIPYYVTVPADDLQLTGYPRLLLSWHGAELNVGWALSQRTACVTRSQKLRICLDVAKAMKYLHELEAQEGLGHERVSENRLHINGRRP